MSLPQGKTERSEAKMRHTDPLECYIDRNVLLAHRISCHPGSAFPLSAVSAEVALPRETPARSWGTEKFGSGAGFEPVNGRIGNPDHQSLAQADSLAALHA